MKTAEPANCTPSPAVSLHGMMKHGGLQVLHRLGFYACPEHRHSDACGLRDQKILCLEIETAAIAHVLINIHRDLANGADLVGVVCHDFNTQAAICRLLARQLDPALRPRVAVITFSLIKFLAEQPAENQGGAAPTGTGQDRNKT